VPVAKAAYGGARGRPAANSLISDFHPPRRSPDPESILLTADRRWRGPALADRFIWGIVLLD
jgi:hypothetical protein